MNLIPEGIDAVTLLSALLSILSAIFGLASSVYAFSSGPRLLKTIDWGAKALEREENPARRRAVEALLRDADSSLFARKQVGASRFFAPFTLTASSLTAIIAYSISMPWWFRIVMALVFIPMLALGVSNLLRLQRERLISHDFFYVGHPDAATQVRSMYWSLGQDRSELILTCRAAGGLLLIGLVAARLAGGNSSIWLTLAGYVAFGQLIDLPNDNRLYAREISESHGVTFQTNHPFRKKNSS